MNRSESFWVYLSLFQSLWIVQTHSESLWICLSRSKSFWVVQNPSESFWIYLNLLIYLSLSNFYVPIWEFIWGFLNLSESFRVFPNIFKFFWIPLTLSESFWISLSLFGYLWVVLNLSEFPWIFFYLLLSESFWVCPNLEPNFFKSFWISPNVRDYFRITSIWTRRQFGFDFGFAPALVWLLWVLLIHAVSWVQKSFHVRLEANWSSKWLYLT